MATIWQQAENGLMLPSKIYLGALEISPYLIGWQLEIEPATSYGRRRNEALFDLHFYSPKIILEDMYTLFMVNNRFDSRANTITPTLYIQQGKRAMLFRFFASDMTIVNPATEGNAYSEYAISARLVAIGKGQ